ncbi:MAG: acetyl-CoA carboxylase biotin carboxylase subunit, partial [Deltaproteobacteria bacterium]
SMGDKITAKETMIKAGVPVLPGSKDEIGSDEEAKKIADEIGYPVIIKAAAGGGGKGMKIVHTQAGLISSLMTARSEAQAAFGNASVYIEKFCERPKHVEIQLLADNYWNIVHLGERDCSIQRRHQKLIEESPCPVLTDRLRDKMGKAAIKAAQAVNYTNVGTVEFLLDGEEFYFMEMNTRIQVEHPVTEMVTGVDLVKEQIRAAAGEKLKIRQRDIKIKGHSIECRINAEDPVKFMPCPGRIDGYHVPGGPGVRVDSAAYNHYTIPPYYDSMIAKLIVYADSRDEAISRMLRALDEYVIEGIKTTIPFHKKLLRDKDFVKGNFDTNFLTRYLG